jgi:hypothetical protein
MIGMIGKRMKFQMLPLTKASGTPIAEICYR